MACYLITGGAGFIGAHLADSLIADGHRIRVLDDLSTGSVTNLPAGAKLIRGDVTNPMTVRLALEGVDACFHLAAIASVERCHQEWLRSHAVNLGGTITVLDEVRRNQLRHGRRIAVIYASSAAVYACHAELPVSESAATCPSSAYGVDKLGCEMHAAVAARVHQLATVGLRFFNVYGPRQRPDSPYSGVISIFCRRMLEGAPIEIHGDGGQVRDFVFIGDAVAALRRALDIAAQEPQVFNVCTGSGTSIIELAEMIAKIGHHSLKPRYLPARIGDLRMSIGDPRRAREELTFSATTTLQDGLTRTVAAMSPRSGEDHARMMLTGG